MSVRSRLLAATLVLCATTASAFAQSKSEVKQPEGPTTGHVYIAGKTPADPPAGEARDTHAYIEIEGPGAVAIFETLQVPAEEDICRGDGWTMKTSGSLACSYYAPEAKAVCNFSVNLRAGTLDDGSPC